MRLHRTSTISLTVLLVALLGVLMAFGLAQSSAGLPLAPNVPVPLRPHLLLEITPRLQNIFSGNTANLTVTITNDGGVPIIGLATSGSSFAACNKTSLGSLNPGEMTSYTCQKSNVGESSLEVLTVAGKANGEMNYEQRADAFIKVSQPDISILKRPTTQTVRPGGTARFTIVIRNEGETDLTNVKVLDAAAPDCGLDPVIPISLAKGERREYTCRLDGVAGPTTTVSTVQGTNPGNGSISQASDVAWVDVLSLEANLTSVPTAVDEPGGEVTFKATIANTGSLPLELVGMTTNKFGNLFDQGNELVPATTNNCLPGPDPISIAPYGGSLTCDFVAFVSGQPSDFSVVLTAQARFGDEEASATASTTVQILDVPALIEVNLTADPSIVSAPGGTVKFTVRVNNFSEADGVVIEKLEDAALGSLAGKGTCVLPTPMINNGGNYECTYSDQVTGSAGQERVRTINAYGFTDDLVPVPVSATRSIKIQITDLPVQKVFLPGISDEVVEPNNTCTLAYPLQLNRQYHFLPPPTYGSGPSMQDYFRFVLTESTSISVELTNFFPRAGQLLVRTGANCATIIGQNTNTALNKTLTLGTQPAGEYFIQITNDGPPETEHYYGLKVKTQ